MKLKINNGNIFLHCHTHPQANEWISIIPSLQDLETTRWEAPRWRHMLIGAWGDVLCGYKTINIQLFLDKMMVYLYLLLRIILDEVVSNANGRLNVTKYWSNLLGASFFILRSSSMIPIHNNSQIPCVIARNSASALDLATIFCFLLLQVNKFPPKNMQYPKVDRLFTIDPA